MKTAKCFVQILLFLFCSSVYAAELPSNSIYHSSIKWTDQDNRSVFLKEFRGKFVVVSMAYLGCKHTCPLTLAKMKGTEKALGKKAKQTQFLLVSFDPKNDTVAEMKKYFTKSELSPRNWKIMTSSNDSDLRELAGLIDFKFKKVGDDEFEHSLALIALDRNGVVVGRIEGATMKPESLAAHLK